MDCFSLNMPDFAYFPCMAATEAAMQGKYETPEIRYQTVFFPFLFLLFLFFGKRQLSGGKRSILYGVGHKCRQKFDDERKHKQNTNKLTKESKSRSLYPLYPLLAIMLKSFFFKIIFFMCVLKS